MKVLPVPNVNVKPLNLRVTRKNEAMLRPQSVPVGGQLFQFVEGWKRIKNDPYVLTVQGVVVHISFY